MSDSNQHQPTPRDYWIVALILAVITAAEVAITYADALDSVVAPMLIAMSAAKFTIVVGYFMHLKYERKLYRNLFLIGLIAAPLLFGAVLFSFGVLIGN